MNDGSGRVTLSRSQLGTPLAFVVFGAALLAIGRRDYPSLLSKPPKLPQLREALARCRGPGSSNPTRRPLETRLPAGGNELRATGEGVR
jgi:hypothetical protein